MPPRILGEATTLGALSWMIEQGMIVKRTTKDPETFIPVQGYILSDDLRGKIGTNLVKLFGKVGRGNSSDRVTIGDGFIAATMAAVQGSCKVSFSEEEMMLCTNIILTFLPFERLEAAGLTGKPLRSLASDRDLLRKFRSFCGPVGPQL